VGDEARWEGASQRECEELRSACQHKDELGDQGEGNCRRYRDAYPPSISAQWLRSRRQPTVGIKGLLTINPGSSGGSQPETK
jgi:hypothetical protein